jgi:hypothetical protein
VRCIVFTKVNNTTGQGQDRARVSVTGTSMTNFLASHCIFLIRENETGKSSVLNVVDRSTTVAVKTRRPMDSSMSQR